MDLLHYMTLELIYSEYLSKSNFKDHYGDAAKEQCLHCLGMIAEINVFSFWRNVASDGVDWASSGRLFRSGEPDRQTGDSYRKQEGR